MAAGGGGAHAFLLGLLASDRYLVALVNGTGRLWAACEAVSESGSSFFVGVIRGVSIGIVVIVVAVDVCGVGGDDGCCSTVAVVCGGVIVDGGDGSLSSSPWEPYETRCRCLSR